MLVLLAGCGGGSLLQAPVSAERPSPATPAPTPSATATATTATPPWQSIESGDWAIANGGLRNTRARDGGFDPDAGESLTAAWEYRLRSSGPYGYAAGAPAIVDGVVYVQSLGGDVSALDLETGTRIWRFDRRLPTAGPIGPAVADGRVYIARGEPLWTVPLEKDGYQPIALGDLVLVGTGNLAHVPGNSGYVHAFDGEDGSLRWSFRVVEDGFWGAPTVNTGGGVWYPPAIDLERGLIYVGTGNAGPYPGTRFDPNGSSRPGPNPYTSALVALEMGTGRLAWFHQVVERGLFDHDFQAPPMLVELAGDGAERSLIIGSGKVGRVVALDADTHEVAWDTAVGRHENDTLALVPAGTTVVVYPGVFGGVETPMATDGDRVFVPVVNLGTPHTATGHGARDGSSALVNASAYTSVSSATGEFVALDAATGELLWRQELDSAVFGGATVWGEHVYTATYDGRIHGFDRETGDEVWTFDTGGRINAWPAVLDDWMVWPVGLGPRPRLIGFRVTAPAQAIRAVGDASAAGRP